MKVNLNNNELVGVLNAIQNYLEYTDDDMVEASLMSFVKKINNQIRTFNPGPDKLVVDLIGQLEEIKELKEEE